ncbi:MAG: nitronate monooxygenase [Rhodospirillaceae bacterium TMED63]|nr:nitronate monooxygenase [Rhodospirillaceae bacterium]RPG01246.1 MAG: nitronate monooxygenase [Rhodospirillaceae bacterium TMED63]
MKPLQPLVISGKEVAPLVEGGKGIAVSNGESSGAWAAAGGVGTFSGVNADSYDENGNLIPATYQGRTRRDRHEELLAYAIQGGIAQARIAHDIAGGDGRIHMNVLWEMGGAERVLDGVLTGARGLIHGVTCGAGMPYKIAQISASYGVYYYPIISSARAFRALWKRSYHKFPEWLGGVVYEDPWRAGGHNGLSNSEDPEIPEDPKSRVAEVRQVMNDLGLEQVPIVMAGGVWYMRDWVDWIDDPDIAPVAFQFGTRPLLTRESPISDQWKKRLLGLEEGDVFLNKYSPTGFYSSAVRNDFLKELKKRSDRQIAFSEEPVGELSQEFQIGPRGRKIFIAAGDKKRAEAWMKEDFTEGMRTPDSTVIFVSSSMARQIRTDQSDCMGCLSQCQFSNWAQNEAGTTGRRPDPRSYCIQKTLQNIVHGENVDEHLMFAGHNAYKFRDDPFYANGYIPTVKKLMERLHTGD